MAIDTAAKRFSMINLGRPPVAPLIIPSGSILQPQRAHFLNLYSGIALKIAANIPFGVWSIIQAFGIGKESVIMSYGQGISMPFIDSSGILSIINTRGLGITSAIANSKGTESDL